MAYSTCTMKPYAYTLKCEISNCLYPSSELTAIACKSSVSWITAVHLRFWRFSSSFMKSTTPSLSTSNNITSKCSSVLLHGTFRSRKPTKFVICYTRVLSRWVIAIAKDEMDVLMFVFVSCECIPSKVYMRNLNPSIWQENDRLGALSTPYFTRITVDEPHLRNRVHLGAPISPRVAPGCTQY